MTGKRFFLNMILLVSCLNCQDDHSTGTRRYLLSSKVGKSEAHALTLEDSPSWAIGASSALGWLSSKCTVFHIGQGYALTSGHCVNALNMQTLDRPCDGISVRWVDGRSLDLGAPQPCRRIVADCGHGDTDYAILRFDKAPEEMLSMAPQGTETTQQVNLVGLPHGQLTYAEGCKATRIAGPREVWHHDCDTAPGASGAPLLRGSDLAVIGIHRGYGNGTNRALDTQFLQELLPELVPHFPKPLP